MPTINITGQQPGSAAAQAAEKAYDPWEASLAEQRVARIKEGEYAAQKQADAQHKAALLLQQRVDRDHAAALRKQQAEQRTMDREQARIETTATARFEKRINQRYRAEQVAARKAVQDREREETRAENTLQQRRQARVRGFERAALVGTAAMAGVHGSFEGATTAVGGIAGAGIGAAVGALGGPFGIAAGAEFGLVLGEAIGKLVKGLVTLPQAPGNIWNAYLGASKPYTDLQVSQYAMARAGGYNGSAALSSIMPGTGSKNIPQWMIALGVSPQEALDSINRTGISPFGVSQQTTMARTIAEYGTTRAYSNLPQGQRESALGQGAHLGLTSVSGGSDYFNKFGGALEMASERSLNKAQVLTNIQDAVEVMARSGAGGISTSALNDVMERFMMGGSPGGRSGATAAAAIGGTLGLLGNLPQSVPGSAAFYQIANRPEFEHLQTEAGIKAFVGQASWDAVAPERRAFITKNVIADMKAGNVIGAMRDIAPLQKADTGTRWRSLTQGLADAQFGKGTALSAQYAASYWGTDVDTVRDTQFSGSLGALPPTGIETDAAKARIISGSGDDSDMILALRGFGVPEKLIPQFMAAQKATGVSAMELAVRAKHENASWNPQAQNRNVSKKGVVTYDYGISQFNSANLANKKYTTNPAAIVAGDSAEQIMAQARFTAINGEQGYNSMAPLRNGLTDAQQVQKEYNDYMGGNIPSKFNEATATAAQTTATGGMDMFNNLNSIVKVAASTAESAAAEVRKFADALDGIKNIGSFQIPSPVREGSLADIISKKSKALFGTDRTQGNAAHQ